MSRSIRWAGAPFSTLHHELMGEAGGIDFSAFKSETFPHERLTLARAVWQDRLGTEFRSIQIMVRFLSDVLAAGDPLDVYAGAVDFVSDEIRHTALCARLVEALGETPRFPDPVESEVPEELRAAPAPLRALNAAISMLCVSETISVAFIADLASRCTEPTIGAVLRATLADEAHHGEWGWAYAKKSLGRFEPKTIPEWARLADQTVLPHRKKAREILAGVPEDRRRLDAWPEPELAALGLFSPERQALVFEAVWEAELVPRLTALGLRSYMSP